MIPFARRTVAEPIQGTKVMMSDRLFQMPLGMRLIINDAHVHTLMHTCTRVAIADCDGQATRDMHVIHTMHGGKTNRLTRTSQYMEPSKHNVV